MSGGSSGALPITSLNCSSSVGPSPEVKQRQDRVVDFFRVEFHAWIRYREHIPGIPVLQSVPYPPFFTN
jgi:hypothetical protein